MTPRLRRKSLRDALREFLGAQEGTAALEFAFIAPVLIGMVLSLSDVANIAMGASNMQTAVRAGIQYALNGGSDMSVARSQGLQAWSSMPPGATLSAQQSCKCGSAAGDCSQPCPDGTYPASYVSLTAVATLGGSIIATTKTTTETARVR